MRTRWITRQDPAPGGAGLRYANGAAHRGATPQATSVVALSGVSTTRAGTARSAPYRP